MPKSKNRPPAKAKALRTPRKKPVPRFALRGQWVSDPECPDCVRYAVAVWCGQQVNDVTDALSDLYAPKHCDKPALEELRSLLGFKCHRTPHLADLDCTMSVHDLIALLC